MTVGQFMPKSGSPYGGAFAAGVVGGASQGPLIYGVASPDEGDPSDLGEPPAGPGGTPPGLGEPPAGTGGEPIPPPEPGSGDLGIPPAGVIPTYDRAECRCYAWDEAGPNEWVRGPTTYVWNIIVWPGKGGKRAVMSRQVRFEGRYVFQGLLRFLKVQWWKVYSTKLRTFTPNLPICECPPPESIRLRELPPAHQTTVLKQVEFLYADLHAEFPENVAWGYFWDWMSPRQDAFQDAHPGGAGWSTGDSVVPEGPTISPGR